MKGSTSVAAGKEIPSLTKTAYMPIDPEARNPIHTEDYAQRTGMRGALISGSILLGYILEMLYNYFGQNWMHYGKISVSFIGGGALNGDIVTAHGVITSVEPEEAGTRLHLDVWMDNNLGNKIVVGTATCLK